MSAWREKEHLIEHNKDVSGSPADSDGILPFPALLCDSRLHLLSGLFVTGKEAAGLLGSGPELPMTQGPAC